MTTPARVVLGLLGATGLVLVAAVLVAVNRDSLSETLGAQSERADVLLFRMGELPSISARLNEEFGHEPDVTYVTLDGRRVLGLSFADDRAADGDAVELRAREIASFAVASTTKSDRIDAVRVSFGADGEQTVFTFTLEDGILQPNPPARRRHDDSRRSSRTRTRTSIEIVAIGDRPIT